jgi:hypothetical protein
LQNPPLETLYYCLSELAQTTTYLIPNSIPTLVAACIQMVTILIYFSLRVQTQAYVNAPVSNCGLNRTQSSRHTPAVGRTFCAVLRVAAAP